MSFLKRFFKKRKIQGKVVYDAYDQEVGEISNVTYNREPQVYDVLTRGTKLKFSFPAGQFFMGESGKVYLLSRESYLVRLSCSKLLELKKKYDELNTFVDVITEETYFKELAEITKSSIKWGEEVIQHLPNFEEYLVTLKKQKAKVIEETSRLMTLRLLEFGRKTSESTPLTKKEYSLKIIELRSRYGDISRLIRFISELYEDAKTSLAFLRELLERVNTRMGAYPSVTPEIQDLMKRANNVCVKGKEITKILDSLVEAVITV